MREVNRDSSESPHETDKPKPISLTEGLDSAHKTVSPSPAFTRPTSVPFIALAPPTPTIPILNKPSPPTPEKLQIPRAHPAAILARNKPRVLGHKPRLVLLPPSIHNPALQDPTPERRGESWWKRTHKSAQYKP
ncbi:hypothetical protein MBM_08346 [Drepanopeziza brunnea f. sp. 'multigermtubi' MB_m1]|uniref:Uncharacterized protein n=1 Tax=Marssonina brunnea f. sp. multigermtubi (strain MB_m1) TaxID=1072389 RepID=K1WYE4_MARBU|nr:uncharacterized protein MBM_08346 [Drepanopeziza brunnea f. sp. 'multigermtubi' MB_m1]EKD13628.1 hypothetical protein MBM_08346 [Drepanopeziza brunnea f. sp. 'multigermtubi' MB_m1]